MARRRPGAADVLVRPGASVRGRAAQSGAGGRVGRRRGGGTRGGRGLVRGRRSVQRTRGHDPDGRRPLGDANAARLRHGRQGRDCRRGRRRRDDRAADGRRRAAVRRARRPDDRRRGGIRRPALASAAARGAGAGACSRGATTLVSASLRRGFHTGGRVCPAARGCGRDDASAGRIDSDCRAACAARTDRGAAASRTETARRGAGTRGGYGPVRRRQRPGRARTPGPARDAGARHSEQGVALPRPAGAGNAHAARGFDTRRASPNGTGPGARAGNTSADRAAPGRDGAGSGRERSPHRGPSRIPFARAVLPCRTRAGVRSLLGRARDRAETRSYHGLR